jgi:transposase
MHIAVVATARKLAVLCWHLTIKGEDYAFALPSLVAHKQRKLELRAGAPPARGRKGQAARYSLAAVRAAERDLAAQGEAAYRTMVAAWQPTRPAAMPSHTKPSKKVDGRSRQHRDAAHQAHRLSSAAGLPVP